MIDTIAILALVLAGLSVLLHLIPAKDIHSAPIAKAQADVDDVWNWIVTHLEHKAATPAAPVAAPAPAGPISVTYHFGATPDQVGVITAPPQPATMNGVPTPAGLTDSQFVSLVVAVQGVQAMVSNPDLHASLMASTQAWWNALGPFFREELLKLGPADLTIGLSALAQAGPALVPITPDQQTAALQAVGAVAPKP